MNSPAIDIAGAHSADRPAVVPKRAHRVAGVLNWGVAGAYVFIGIDYLTSTMPKPHHLEMLSVPWQQIPVSEQTLIMTLMKGTGLVAIVTAVSMSILLIHPFRRKESWVRPALLIVCGTSLIPTLIATFQVRAATASNAPWWPHILMLSALGAAYWLTRDFEVPGTCRTSPEHGVSPP